MSTTTISEGKRADLQARIGLVATSIVFAILHALTPAYFLLALVLAFYLGWLRPALFAGYLSTDIGDDVDRENYQSIGFQLDLGFTVVHKLPMTLSLGFARGYIDGHHYDDEVMLSLKVL